MNTERIIIRTSDIELLFGITKSAASRQMRIVKAALNKKHHQRVSIIEFAEYMDLDADDIKNSINN